MPLSPATVKQYAEIVLRAARLKRLPITLSKSSWYRTRAALAWALSNVTAQRTREDAQRLAEELKHFFEKKAPQLLRPENDRSKARALNSKTYSAAKMIDDHCAKSGTETWRERLWASLDHHHRSAIAAMMVMPLRPVDVQKGISVKVTRANANSPWGRAAVAVGELPPDTVEFICLAGKLDRVQYFDREGQLGMIQTSLEKGQAWRRFIFKLDDSPWLRWLEERDGMPIDLGRLKHAKSVSTVIKKAAQRAGFGNHVTANTLKHLVVSEYKAFAAAKKMKLEDVSKAASHSSAATTRMYGQLRTGRKSLRSQSSHQPPLIESAQGVRKLAVDALRLNSLPAKRSGRSRQPLDGPLASPRSPKPKGFK